MRLLENGCPCSGFAHPPKPMLPPGLTALSSRQALGFREIRRALLARLNDHDALDDWRVDPRQQIHQDLGVMLLDFTAYVLAVTGFYDARIAERAYIAPAPDAEVLQEIVSLIGYVPRPAIVAKMRLALEAAGADPVTLSPTTAFRSDAFDEEPPQVFEALDGGTVWPARNRWSIAALAEPSFNGTLLFRDGAVPHINAVMLVANSAATSAAAGQVARVRPLNDSNGSRFRRVTLDSAGGSALTALMGTSIDDLNAQLLRVTAGVSPYVATPLSVSGSTATVYLDAVYGQIRSGDAAVLEAGGVLYPGKVDATTAETIQFTRTVDSTSVTQTVLQSRVTMDLLASPADTSNARLHFSPAQMGPLKTRGKEVVVLSDMLGGVDLDGPIDALGDAPALAQTLLQGAGKLGAEIAATVVRSEDDAGTLTPAVDAKEFATGLRQPIQAFGNVIEVVRGETVRNEVLGSSDGQRPYQTFALKKKPLSWIENAADPAGRSAFIDVAVDGVRWQFVRHLTQAGPEDRVFALKSLPDGNTEVCFGDGEHGAVPPSGVDNIVALSYRYGGGAAKPPAGGLTQFKRPVREISRVRSPLPATGGADAETPDELKLTAPDFALTLGRAVSVADFEAMARSYSGVLNARATWHWEAARQRALVRVAMIPDQGDPSADLATYLEDRAAPGLGVEVLLAQSQVLPLSVDVLKASDFIAEQVEKAVFDALLDPYSGLLAPRQLRLGAPLMRSEVVHALHRVPGVEAVTSLRLGASEFAAAVAPSPPAEWFDFTDNLSIGVS